MVENTISTLYMQRATNLVLVYVIIRLLMYFASYTMERLKIEHDYVITAIKRKLIIYTFVHYTALFLANIVLMMISFNFFAAVIAAIS